MKTFLLILTITLTGCTTMGGVLNGSLAACIEAQKSMSRDQTMRDIAILEMAKTANDQTKMAAMTAITQSKSQNIICK
jgi:hypothetical protein